MWNHGFMGSQDQRVTGKSHRVCGFPDETYRFQSRWCLTLGDSSQGLNFIQTKLIEI